MFERRRFHGFEPYRSIGYGLGMPGKKNLVGSFRLMSMASNWGLRLEGFRFW